MATKMTANGVSTTTAPGTEQYEVFYIGFRNRSKRCQCDYRHTDGELFSCVAPTFTECRRKRDEWLRRKANN
ncbi:MAG: DUF3873 domain-containing protein [Muribaculaceae bacterium]|nr:DUF3873 domain-containing protein [Muribaculaceae bacterium]